MTGADAVLWSAVDRWIDAAPLPSDLADHRLQLLAARRLRDTGRPVPPEFVEHERMAAVVAMTAPLVLERVREALAGPLVLFKGMEVAARYPEPALRIFHDLDVLVPDAPAAQARLLAAGFEEVGDAALYVDIHHLRPLKWPTLPTMVEVHHGPKWPVYAAAPAAAELIGSAMPGSTGVPGVLALRPPAHALVLAAHSWSNVPLGRLRDLLDVHLVAAEAEPADITALARRWGMERVWETTCAASAALLDPRRRPTVPLLTWARGLRRVRSRTVLEYHLERWTSCFWAIPPRRALGETLSVVRRELRPEADEGWSRKLRRTVAATRDARRRKRDHDERLSR